MQCLPFVKEALLNEVMHAKYSVKQHTHCHVSINCRQNNPTEDESGVKAFCEKVTICHTFKI